VTFTVSNTPVVTGLVGAWGFEDGAGTTATDSSGRGLNGTVADATWTAAGRFGGALAFNGTNSWVTVADNAALDLTTGMTLEAWVKPGALAGWTTVMMKERGTAGLGYALYASDNAGQPPAAYVYRNADVSALGTSALAIGAWTHLSTTYDGANLRLYVNGALVRTRAVTGSLPNTANPFRIGGNGVWGEYFNGVIDEVRVYNRALTQTEIQSDMGAAVSPAPAAGAVLAPLLAASAAEPVDVAKTAATRSINGRVAPPPPNLTVKPPARTTAPSPFAAKPIGPAARSLRTNIARDNEADTAHRNLFA
jgi:hypothetical protein